MTMYDNECACVQGVEVFLDPRIYMPQWETPDTGAIEDSAIEWQRKREEKAYAEEQQEKIDNTNVVVNAERVAEFVVQRNVLVPTGFTHFVAYQIQSMYIRIKTLDEYWLNSEISAIFTHKESNTSRTVPVLKLDSLVTIPAEVLRPGTLNIALTGIKLTGEYQVVTTEAMTYKVYDAGIKPIKWPKMKDYDVYLNYQRLAKNLIAEVDSIKKDNVVYSDNIAVTYPVTVVCDNAALPAPTIVHADPLISYSYDANRFTMQVKDIELQNVNGTETSVTTKLNLKDIGIKDLDIEGKTFLGYTQFNDPSSTPLLPDFKSAVTPSFVTVQELTDTTGVYQIIMELPYNQLPEGVIRHAKLVIPELSFRRIKI